MKHAIRFVTFASACLAANVLAISMLTTSAFAAEAGAPGKTVEDLAKPCAACHGPDGNSTNAQYPRIAGQYHDYLARAMQEYKTGERKNAIMAGFVNTLSNADIDALARFYAEKQTKLDDLAHYEQGD
jgi:cytochrome c553